ncbi:MAG: DUF5723 family protein [Flavobacteriales bacterium]
MAKGQFGMGLAGGSWEGIWGLHHQPASILLNQDRMEVNVFRAGIDAYANFLEIDPNRFGILNFNDGLVLDKEGPQVHGTDRLGENSLFDLRTLGPSLARRVGKHGAWAFTTAGRVIYTGLDPRATTGRFGLDTLLLRAGEERLMEAVDMRANTATWAEAGLTYGRTFNDAGKVRIHAAATGKFIVGGRAGYLVVSPPVVEGMTDSTTAIAQVDIDHALALPHDWNTAGRGWNADLGAIIEVMRRDWAPDMRPYRLRFGVAFTDLGSVNYKEGAGVYRIRNGTTTSDQLAALQVDNVAGLDTALSSLLLGDPVRSRVGTAFKLGLPAALHLSLEFCPAQHWAVRAEGVLNMRHPPEALSTREQIAITPRFETRMLMVAVPFTMDRYGTRGLGLCLRLGGAMLGSDRLGGLIGMENGVGADFYCGIKLRFKEKEPE